MTVSLRVAVLARAVMPLHGLGGLERSVHDLVRHLAARDVAVTLIVPPATKEIGEIIVSGSDRSPEALSLDEVLNYFVDSPLNLPVSASPPAKPPPAPKPEPAPHAKKRDPADRARVTQEVRRRR